MISFTSSLTVLYCAQNAFSVSLSEIPRHTTKFYSILDTDSESVIEISINFILEADLTGIYRCSPFFPSFL